MTRKKVKLAFIANDSARKATYKKRKKGFLKKMYELTTLCEIKACAIIYSPFDAQPEVWPNVQDAQHVLAKFRRLPEIEKNKKMINQEEFLKQRISKVADQLKKLQKENREKEMTHIMHQCLTGKGIEHMTMLDLNDLGWLLDRNLKEIYKRLDELAKEDGPTKAMAKQAGVIERGQGWALHGESCGGPRGGFDHMGLEQPMQGQSWFMDLMSTQDHGGGFSGNDAGGSGKFGGGSNLPMTFADYSQNTNPLWSSAFFP